MRLQEWREREKRDRDHLGGSFYFIFVYVCMCVMGDTGSVCVWVVFIPVHPASSKWVPSLTFVLQCAMMVHARWDFGAPQHNYGRQWQECVVIQT